MSNICPICWESLSETPVVSEGERLVLPTTCACLAGVNVCCTSCGHLFHKQCLLTYLLAKPHNSGPCPTCKGNITARKVYPAYCSGLSGNGGGGGDGFTEDNECPICLEVLSDAPSNARRTVPPKSAGHLARANACCTPCGHLFHRECLFAHLTSNLPSTAVRKNSVIHGSCPTCSTHVDTLRKIYPVYSTASQPNPPTAAATMKRSISPGSSSSPAVPAKQMKSSGDSSQVGSAPPPAPLLRPAILQLAPAAIVAPTPSTVMVGQSPPFVARSGDSSHVGNATPAPLLRPAILQLAPAAIVAQTPSTVMAGQSPPFGARGSSPPPVFQTPSLVGTAAQVSSSNPNGSGNGSPTPANSTNSQYPAARNGPGGSWSEWLPNFGFF